MHTHIYACARSCTGSTRHRLRTAPTGSCQVCLSTGPTCSSHCSREEAGSASSPVQSKSKSSPAQSKSNRAQPRPVASRPVRFRHVQPRRVAPSPVSSRPVSSRHTGSALIYYRPAQGRGGSRSLGMQIQTRAGSHSPSAGERCATRLCTCRDVCTTCTTAHAAPSRWQPLTPWLVSISTMGRAVQPRAVRKDFCHSPRRNRQPVKSTALVGVAPNAPVTRHTPRATSLPEREPQAT